MSILDCDNPPPAPFFPVEDDYTAIGRFLFSNSTDVPPRLVLLLREAAKHIDVEEEERIEKRKKYDEVKIGPALKSVLESMHQESARFVGGDRTHNHAYDKLRALETELGILEVVSKRREPRDIERDKKAKLRAIMTRQLARILNHT